MNTHPEERKLAAIMFTDMVVLKLATLAGTCFAAIRALRKL
jgi:hypothetical protein